MKAFQKFLVVVIVLGLVAAYFLWPYFEIRRFAAAVNKKDKATVEEMVDADELRASLKKLITDGLLEVAKMKGGPNADPASVQQSIEAFTESPQGKAMLEQAVKPEALATMLTLSAKTQKEVPMAWQNEKWVGPLEFRVQDTESSGYLVMKLKGLNWKVTGLEIPASELKNYVMQQRNLPMGAVPR